MDDKVDLNTRVSKKVRARVDKASRETGISITRIVENALNEYLNRMEGKK